MRVLVSGDRVWDNREKLFRILDSFADQIDLIIEGCAKGADSLAEQWAILRGKLLWHFPADWEKYKRSAGPIRNSQMLKEGKPDMVIAFHNNISKSSGTKNMINQALKEGLPVYLVSDDSMEQIIKTI